MSDAAVDVTFPLKVMVNKEKTKVLFAEADSDFVSVLLSLLTLPLGRIVKLLEKHYAADKSPVLGSISSLYKGLANLDDVHFSNNVAKLMLLDPPSSFDSIFRKFKLDIFNAASPPKYFVCGHAKSCNTHRSICMYYGGTARCGCGLPLNLEVVVNDSEEEEDGVPFTINTASFIISDDLKMVPNSTGFYQTLNNFGITAADGAELRILNLGTNEIMDLVKCCLLSKTPLTDFILNKGEIISFAAKPEPGTFFLHQTEIEEPTNAKRIVLKVMVHKPTNKVLFAQAENDFVELLSSFLIIPVAGVESLLGTNTGLNSLDNLHRSVSDVSLDKYFVTIDTKKGLMNPNIPHSSKSKYTFLPLNYESAPKIYFGWDFSTPPPRLLISHKFKYYAYDIFTYKYDLFTFKSPKGEGNYIKQPTTYLVTDDLTVTPFHVSSAFSILNRLNIPLSDVSELEVHIGLQEALSILKASLTSDSALTNGLMINRVMKKQPKQER